MANEDKNNIKQDDDMDFFKTIFPFTSKMKPIDNFEFRQDVMAVVKKYVYCKDTDNYGAMNANNVIGFGQMTQNYKREPDNDGPSDSKHTRILTEIKNQSLLGRGHVVNQPFQIKSEPVIKKENINPWASAFAKGFLPKGPDDVIEIDSDVEEVN